MKLAELIPHTAAWLGLQESWVTTIAKELRFHGLISTGGRGPGGAEMTEDDKLSLLVAASVCDGARACPQQLHHCLGLPVRGLPPEGDYPALFSFFLRPNLKAALLAMFD